MIDREKLISALEYCTFKKEDDERHCPYVIYKNCGLKLKEDALELLKNQTEVVRCKDCKHRGVMAEGQVSGRYITWPDIECPFQSLDDPSYSWIPVDDWYCPRGERETDV